MLKKCYLAMLSGSLLVSANAMALSDNTITFQGEVTDETCSVAINGNQATPVVLLPTVSSTDLGASGDTAGPVTFDIGLTGCTGDTTNATKISTVFVGNQVTTNGNLGNTGTASNVEVQILDTKGTEINLTNGFTGTGDLTLAAGEKEVSATYTAQYYANGKATAGTVEATMQYAVSYQ
ncbi:MULTISPECIES: fimbrial protein [Pseudocitrobacter]|uniref:Major type 1 subunit fimbrin (Pilin) n=1 Tax=Pseudocitrobacter faecalis TaxID=1398493 RepID=A0ABX9G4I2_9ENTR|nr:MULTISPECIES: fimbrial protein [Pseudocitrobacter]RAU52674.1 type 1 fimbrial protein [Pseudocitrobacter sp. RIT 415]RBP15375.1 major type 1 subunit fimbrin (pilin) [Pseudocitrobacter faecalis]UYW74367.1 type 1 fimbrial protein [Pseudocitrobacter faecalis]GHD90028.1 fimbrial protein [Pseudocitrobacter faecalis]